MKELVQGRYDAVIVPVGHDEFRSMSTDALRELGKTECVIFDVKGIFPPTAVDGRL